MDSLAIHHPKRIKVPRVTRRSTPIQRRRTDIRQQQRRQQIKHSTQQFPRQRRNPEAPIQVVRPSSRDRHHRAADQRGVIGDLVARRVVRQGKDGRRASQRVRDGIALEEQVSDQALETGDQGREAALQLGVDVDGVDVIGAAAALGRDVAVAEDA